MVGVPGMFPGQQEEVAGVEGAGEWRLAGGEGRFCWAVAIVSTPSVILAQLHPSPNSTVNSLFPSSRDYPLLTQRREITVMQRHVDWREFQKEVNCVSCP